MSLLQLGSNALIRQAFQSDAPARQDIAFASNATTAQAFSAAKSVQLVQASQNAISTQASQPNAKASASLKTEINPPPPPVFSSKLIKRFAILLVSFFLIGCGGGGGDDDDDDGGSLTITAIAAGGDGFSFALNSDGKVYATGFNGEGQLGMGDTVNRNRFTLVSSLNGKTIKAIDAGGNHALALANNGKVYGTGENYNGALGLGNTNQYHSFTVISSLSETIKAIAVGGNHSLALGENGKVYAAGANGGGELGLGDTTEYHSFMEVSSLNGITVTAIAAGGHSLALDENGKVYAAGYNEHGELGLGDTNEHYIFTEISWLSDKNIIAIAAGSDYSLALASDGKVYAAGYNEYGGLGLGDTAVHDQFTEISWLSDKNIIAIAAGVNYSSFAIASDGKVYATGDNYAALLGLGDETDRDEFEEVTSLSGKKIIAIAAGGAHSLALDENGKIYATGANWSGELGLGDTIEDCNEFTEVEF